jgi:putative FmdB family regulatory protein
MPTYDYRCEACGHGFELFQSIKADPVKDCPKCGADQVRRVVGAGAGFIFKGSGFYITDYTRSKDYQEKSKSETSKPASAESKPAEKKSEAPAPKESSGSGSGSASSGSSSPSAAPAA